MLSTVTASTVRNESDLANQHAIAVLGRILMLSADEFSLTLVRCNYQRLEQRTLQLLQDWVTVHADPLPIAWQVVTLSSEQTHLLSALQHHHQRAPDRALMVMGLSQRTDLGTLLEGMNRDRDEFRKQTPVPVVLWLTDDGFSQLTRLALDFKTWSAASVKIELSMQECLALWWETVEDLFEQLLIPREQLFLSNQALDLAPGCQRRRELESVHKQMHVTPVNQAMWHFIQGRDAFAAGDFSGAIALFQRSLVVWSRKQGSWTREPLHFKIPDNLVIKNPFLENKGLLLYHLGLCWARKAQQPGGEETDYWAKAQDRLGASWEIFAIKKRHAIAAQILLQLGYTLQQRRDWSALQQLGESALEETAIQNQPTALAQVYGFLAQVALGRREFEQCNHYVQQSLTLIADANLSHTQHLANLLLTLAKCQAQQGEPDLSLQTLERIRQELVEYWYSCSDYSLLTREQLYGDVLMQLRWFYFAQGQYWEAFERKQEHLNILRHHDVQVRSPDRHTPRSGEGTTTSDIWASSGRNQAVQDFLERLSRSDHRLTILHGSSGVGKSEFLRDDLIPTLERKILMAREVVPVLQDRYRDWEPNLCQQFQRCMPRSLAFPVTDTDSLLLHLQHNSERRLMTVLILDQFENFFVACSQPESRDRFYAFLGQVLQTPFTKIILAIREDTLNVLLTLEQNVNLQGIDDNILDRKIRYALKNLNCAEAQRALQSLRMHNAPPFELELIETFVQDLADTDGRVRPLELRLLGSQLQDRKITTLAQYQQLGPNPKEHLTIQALDTIIEDCGPENKTTAWRVLLSLTHDRNTRLLKTRSELWRLLVMDRPQTTARTVHSTDIMNADDPRVQQLDLILMVLVGSDLVVILQDGREHRYQISHDYLVPTIRRLYQERTDEAIEARFAQSERRLHRAWQQQRRAYLIGGVMGIVALGAGLWAGQVNQQRRLAQQNQLQAELRERSATAQVALVEGDPFTALTHAVRAGAQLQQHQITPQASETLTPSIFPLQTQPPVPTAVQLRVIATLEQALHQIWERNHLHGHQETVWDAAYTPDGQHIASVGHDGTVKLWSTQGQNLATLTDAEESLTSVALRPLNRGYEVTASGRNGQLYQWQVNGRFNRGRLRRQWLAHPEGAINAVVLSPDQRQLATASEDGMIKLWTVEGELLRVLTGHQAGVRWVAFSPDGQQLVSASKDQTLKRWSVNSGALQQTLRGHQSPVSYVAFSPDGETLASVGDEQTIYLWTRQGELLRRWDGHDDTILTVQFDADGQKLVTGSSDRTLKIWDLEGHLHHTLKSHRGIVTAVRFSPDGQILLSSSADKTVKLWQVGGQPRLQWSAHEGLVQSLDFEPQGQWLASGGNDHVAKLWTTSGRLHRTLQGHQDAIAAVRFAPNGQTLATASFDHQVGLWQPNGYLQQWLTGHRDKVIDVRWSPDGQLLASGSLDRTVRVWQRGGQFFQRFDDLQESVNAIAWSPDSQWLAATDNQDLLLWPREGSQFGEPTAFTSEHRDRVALNFLMDTMTPAVEEDSWLSSASYDNMVELWNREGAVVRQLSQVTDSVHRFQLSPDGEIFALITWDHRLQLWHWENELIHEWVSDQPQLTSLAWQADGSAIATGGSDGTIVMWRLDLDTLMKQGCRWLADYFQSHPNLTERDRDLCAVPDPNASNKRAN